MKEDQNVFERNSQMSDDIPRGDYACFSGTLQAQTSTGLFENALHNLKLCRPIHRQISDGTICLTLEQICQVTYPQGRQASTLL